MAFTEDGTPLGSIDAKIWARDEFDSEQPKLSKAAKEKKRRATPIEEKESIRWLEGIRAVQKLAMDCPDTLYVSLSDSEGDMYDLFVEPRTTDNLHWIVRACHDRTVLDSQGNPVGAIRDSLLKFPVLFTNDISVQGRKQKIACETKPRRTSRVSRQATVEVRAGSVIVKAPSLGKHAIPTVTINVVMVREPHPPEGEHPIEWILLTTLPISTMEHVRSVIRCYTVRWMIEIYFRTLKSGCRIEERRFETLDRMLACTAIYMIVAWRTLYVCRLGRSCPEMDCEMIFDPAEWQSVWSVTHRGEPLPTKPPPLAMMVRLIASLGGYVDRLNRLDPPGVETVWKGLQRMRDLAWGWETFGPGAPKK
jgi:desulfoferrodoxin (superoxide reductase-like protein)